MSSEGTPTILKECRRCGQRDARGIRYYWEGGWEFQCDLCGKKMLLGYDEEANFSQVEAKRDHKKSLEKRDRSFREMEFDILEDYRKAKEEGEEINVFERFAPLFDGRI